MKTKHPKNPNDQAIEVFISEDGYDALPTIDIIASGYEFDCLSCGTYNTLIAIPNYGNAVECHHCHAQFKVEESTHAHE